MVSPSKGSGNSSGFAIPLGRLQRRRNVFKIGGADFVKLLTGGGGGGCSPLRRGGGGGGGGGKGGAVAYDGGCDIPT